MAKYFYTDPLAAAWMAKHFGMRFTSENRTTLAWDKEFSCFYLPDDSRAEQEFNGNHYIHPDSVHLLEPKVGDLFIGHRDALYRADETLYPKQGGEWEPGVCWRIVDCHSRYFPSAWGDERKIIQRNGIPFMWPEKEE